MNLTLLRGASTLLGTPGALLRPNGTRIAYSLELPWQDNRRCVSCIPEILPPGRYPVKLVHTPKRGAVYLVQNVRGRDSILIHSGNTIHDTLGCILLGLQRGYVGDRFAVFLSRAAITAFMNEMQGQPFNLEIVWTSSLS